MLIGPRCESLQRLHRADGATTIASRESRVARLPTCTCIILLALAHVQKWYALDPTDESRETGTDAYSRQVYSKTDPYWFYLPLSCMQPVIESNEPSNRRIIESKPNA